MIASADPNRDVLDETRLPDLAVGGLACEAHLGDDACWLVAVARRTAAAVEADRAGMVDMCRRVGDRTAAEEAVRTLPVAVEVVRTIRKVVEVLDRVLRARLGRRRPGQAQKPVSERTQV